VPVRRVPLVAEVLEDRSAPANLRITNLSLSDGNGNPISVVPLGEQVVLRADWVSDNLTAGREYFVRFTFDGVNFDNEPISAQAGSGLLYAEVGKTWFATPGQHTVSAKIDGGNSIAESNESDNTRSMAVSPGGITGPATRFLYPLSSKPARRYQVWNYVDVDPRPDAMEDYAGGPFVFHDHQGTDVGPRSFSWQDAGYPVLAVAPGIVTLVEDGEFDRETDLDAAKRGNGVVIDHGNGWATVYWHFAANSITVKEGDSVTAGQLLGLDGSSGHSGGIHLHFAVEHNFAPVETMYDAAKYFVNPPLYQGAQDPIVVDSGTTNFSLTNEDWYERPSEVTVFPASASGFAITWFAVSNFPQGQPVVVKWYRPDGAVETQQTYTPTSKRGDIVAKSLPLSTLSTDARTWEAVLEIGGKEIGRNLIRVTAQAGEPEIRVTQGTTVVLDERTTPIDFGTVAQGNTPPQLIFTIHNRGYVPLSTSNFIAPPGFSLVGQMPSFIPVGASADFTLRMETGTVGSPFGVLKFDTSDTDEATFNFLVKGTVTGTPTGGAPVVGLPGPAVPFIIGESARLIDPTATLTDSDTGSYTSGSLKIEIIQGGSANDRLAVQHQGTGAGQIGVSGTTIQYGGTTIGTFTGGTGTAPLVVTFNSSAATPTAIQALLQNVTYRNVASTPDTRPRFLRVTAIDPSNKASNVAIKRVSLMMDPFNDAPAVGGIPPTLPAVTEDTANPPGVQVLSFTSSTVTDPDGIDPKGIAITAQQAGAWGAWQFSLDGGTTWKSLGSVSNSAARLLRETDFVRFVPALNVNNVSPTFSYRAWDQSTGLFGSTVDLTAVGSAGGTTAFSNNAMTASLSVTAVNDPPTFTKGPDDTVAEDSGQRTLAGWATQMTTGPPDESSQSLVEFLVTNDNAALFAAAPAVDLTGKLTYTPAPNAHGTATVSVRLRDSGGTTNGGNDTSDPQTFTITITPVNDAPVLDNTGNMALAAILEDQTANAGALITDLIASAGGDRITDPDAGAVEGIAVTDADTIHGSWQFSTNNGGTWTALGAVSTVSARLLAADASTRVRFIPAVDFNGANPTALTFRAWDRTSGANGDLASTSPNGGTTAFSTAIETASLAITPVNDRPSFSKGPDKTVFEDAGPQSFSGWATNLSKGPPDEDSQSLSFEINGNTNPSLFSAGPAVDSLGKLTFITALNQNGSATITLRVRDNGGTANGGQDASAQQSFSISVNPVNDTPTFTKGPNQRLMLENAGPQTVPNWATNIRPGPPDEVGQSITFEVTNVADPSLFAELPAVSPAGTLTYTPAAGVHGYSLVNLRLKDNGGTANGGNDTSPEQQFWIGVAPVNQAPSFTAGGPVTALEDGGVRTIPGWATDIWPGSFFELDQVLTFEVVANSNPDLFAFGPVVDANGTLIFESAPNANGAATIEIRLRDDGGTFFGGQDTSATQSFTITVLAVNDAPSFTAGNNPSVSEDAGPQVVPAWATAISAGPPDEAGQAVTFDIVGNSNPALFSVAPAVAPDGTLTFTPAADAFGSASIQVRARDDGGTANSGLDTSPSQTFTITVRPVNDAPAFAAGANSSVAEDAGPQTVVGWATAISAGPPNESGQFLSFEITSNTNASLFAMLPAVAANGTLTYTPAANAFGTATVTVQLHDTGGTTDGGQDTSSEQTFSITIRPVNDAPSFVVGADQTSDEDSGLVTVPGWATALAAGPPNESGQSLAFTVVGNSNSALFASGPAVAADGTLTFTPADNANGQATVSVEIADDGGTADGGVDIGNMATFTIRVLPVNDPPVAADDSVTALVGKPLTINVLANDSDVDHDMIRVLSFTSPANGTLRRQGNNLLYTTRLTSGGSDAFTYTVTDGHGGVASGSVAITVVDTIAPRIQAVRLYYGPAAYADASSLARGVLPWERLHRVAIVFSEGVIVNPAALAITGLGGSIPTTFSYDAATRTATWTPTVSVSDGRFTLRLAAAGVADASGNVLAADWARTIGLLAGDYDGNGVVTDADLRAIRNRIGTRDRFADVDGNGLVTAADYDLAKANKGRRLR
jgi:murein DD-endopeptidase MepM/ murein hydrolase activator NlpD